MVFLGVLAVSFVARQLLQVRLQMPIGMNLEEVFVSEEEVLQDARMAVVASILYSIVGYLPTEVFEFHDIRNKKLHVIKDLTGGSLSLMVSPNREVFWFHLSEEGIPSKFTWKEYDRLQILFAIEIIAKKALEKTRRADGRARLQACVEAIAALIAAETKRSHKDEY